METPTDKIIGLVALLAMALAWGSVAFDLRIFGEYDKQVASVITGIAAFWCLKFVPFNR